MFNVNQLQQAIQNPSNTALTDDQLAAQLSTPSYGPVDFVTFQVLLMSLPCWVKVSLAADDATIDATIRGLCIIARDLLTNFRGATVDYSSVQFQTILADLTAAGMVGTTENTTILALGAIYPCGDVVAASDVTAARAALALANARTALTQWWQNKSTAVITSIDQGYQNGVLPAQSDLLALVSSP